MAPRSSRLASDLRLIYRYKESLPTVALPTLQNIFSEGLEPSGPVQGEIKEFIAAREPCGYPWSLAPFPSERVRTGSDGVGDRCRIRVSPLRAKARTKGMRYVGEMGTP
jgi:hypothetical protein